MIPTKAAALDLQMFIGLRPVTHHGLCPWTLQGLRPLTRPGLPPWTSLIFSSSGASPLHPTGAAPLDPHRVMIFYIVF
jgi:hypothetical protein